MLRLALMTDADYADYLTRLIPEYAADHVRAGNWTADEAEAKAAAQVREILPDGPNTPDHYLYLLHVDEEPEPVGVLWLGVMRHSARSRVFIYDILIHESYRRRGYASQALLAAEAQARDLGANHIALHVFGHNHGARALYEKLGYTVSDLVMVKELGDEKRSRAGTDMN